MLKKVKLLMLVGLFAICGTAVAGGSLNLGGCSFSVFDNGEIMGLDDSGNLVQCGCVWVSSKSNLMYEMYVGQYYLGVDSMGQVWHGQVARPVGSFSYTQPSRKKSFSVPKVRVKRLPKGIVRKLSKLLP